MQEPRDPRKPGDAVVMAALEYESATLHALQTFLGTNGAAQREACLTWCNALAVINALPAEDYDRGLTHLRERGRIPDNAWQVIKAAMEQIFATGMETASPGQGVPLKSARRWK